LPGTVQAASSGAVGFDCDTKLTADSASAFAAAGFRFAIRYLTRDAPEAESDLTTQEALDILGAGLALMAVQHVAPAGWVPSAGLGTEQGGYAAANAMLVGLPPGVSVWLDLEGVAAGTPSSDVAAYCNAWYAPVAEAGYVPGLYVGSGDILDGDELFEDLAFTLFCQSGSDVPDVATYGYCMVQTIAGDVLDGVAYDSDVVQPDDLCALPFWLAPAPDSPVSFTIAPDPVVPGSPVTFTLSWEVADGAPFQILADDGPSGSTYALPVPVSGSGSYVVTPKRLEVTYTLQLLSGQ